MYARADLEDGIDSGLAAEAEIRAVRGLHGDALLDLLLAHEGDVDPVSGRDGDEGHEPAHQSRGQGGACGDELVEPHRGEHAGGRGGGVSDPELFVSDAHGG